MDFWMIFGPFFWHFELSFIWKYKVQTLSLQMNIKYLPTTYSIWLRKKSFKWPSWWIIYLATLIIEDLTEIGIPSEINPTLIKSYKENNPDMDLAMVILDFKNSDAYARVKLLGDTGYSLSEWFDLPSINPKCDFKLSGDLGFLNLLFAYQFL